MDFLFHDQLLVIIGRLLLAILLSGLIGIEREINLHPAGFRTHLLVGVGSCLMMILSLYGFEPFLEHDNIQFDPARIPSYVISGIGFLGAGTILVKDSTVRGLTTAASIWVVAGLGLIIGAGLYSVSIITTVVILIILISLNKFEGIFLKRRKIERIELVLSNKDSLVSVISLINKYNGHITSVLITPEDSKEMIKVSCSLPLQNRGHVIEHLFLLDGVKNFTNS